MSKFEIRLLLLAIVATMLPPFVILLDGCVMKARKANTQKLKTSILPVEVNND